MKAPSSFEGGAFVMESGCFSLLNRDKEKFIPLLDKSIRKITT